MQPIKPTQVGAWTVKTTAKGTTVMNASSAFSGTPLLPSMTLTCVLVGYVFLIDRDKFSIHFMMLNLVLPH